MNGWDKNAVKDFLDYAEEKIKERSKTSEAKCFAVSVSSLMQDLLEEYDCCTMWRENDAENKIVDWCKAKEKPVQCCGLKSQCEVG